MAKFFRPLFVGLRDTAVGSGLLLLMMPIAAVALPILIVFGTGLLIVSPTAGVNFVGRLRRPKSWTR